MPILKISPKPYKPPGTYRIHTVRGLSGRPYHWVDTFQWVYVYRHDLERIWPHLQLQGYYFSSAISVYEMGSDSSYHSTEHLLKDVKWTLYHVVLNFQPHQSLSHLILFCTFLTSFRQNLDSIAMSMQGKMLEIKARQEGQRHRAATEPGK